MIVTSLSLRLQSLQYIGDLCRHQMRFSGTALSLLEAQAAVGSIANPITGQHMPVDDALEQGLLDKQFAAVLKRAERAVTGFKPKGSDETLSLFQAMKRVSQL